MTKRLIHTLPLSFCQIFLLSGCSNVPSLDILGSFFPSWMLCAVLGVFLTSLLHALFVKTRIVETIPLKLVIYPLMAASAAFTLWLIWFGN